MDLNIPNYKDVYNPLKYVFWKDEIQKLKNNEIIAPKMFEIHPEAWCNNNCSFCYYRDSNWHLADPRFKFYGEWAKGVTTGDEARKKGKRIPGVSSIPLEIALRLPREMEEEGVIAAEITGSGEPTLYPYIRELLTSLSRHNREIALVTHGQQLTNDILDCIDGKLFQWVRFSMDSCTPETHNIVHRTGKAAFDKAVKNIQRVIERKNKGEYQNLVVGISFIITKDNYHEIFNAASFYKNLGVNNIRFSFEFEPTLTGKLSKEVIGECKVLLSEAKKLQDENFRVFGQLERLDYYSRPNTDFTYCGYQMFVWNIGYDSLCYPCCIQIYRQDFAFGNLKKQSLHEIIYGEKRKEYLKNFDVKNCSPCWLRDRNITIETIARPERRLGHVNYP